jgi:hypothetical protein
MIKLSNFSAALFSVAIVIFFAVYAGYAASQPIGSKDIVANPISVVVSTDRARYSLADNIKISVFLENTSQSVIYVDQRMFWTGLSGGLALYFADEHGSHVPAHVLSDAMMPPPPENDTSILVRLEPGFFYGTSIGLVLKDFFAKPGKYSIRVTYKSMLPKELVAPQLRDLPALWMDTPPITSDPIWIDVAQ